MRTGEADRSMERGKDLEIRASVSKITLPCRLQCVVRILAERGKLGIGGVYRAAT